MRRDPSLLGFPISNGAKTTEPAVVAFLGPSGSLLPTTAAAAAAGWLWKHRRRQQIVLGFRRILRVVGHIGRLLLASS